MTRLTTLMTALRLRFGNHCAICESTESLEFAHVTPTSLNGKGRGGLDRAYDIKRNPLAYRLLCRPCHLRYDAFLKRAHKLRIRVHGRWYLGSKLKRKKEYDQ